VHLLEQFLHTFLALLTHTDPVNLLGGGHDLLCL
jgi:hypothetical protein